MHCNPLKGLQSVSNQDDSDLSWEQRLAASHLEIQRLREENAQLRKASTAFGQLAERLNMELQMERRQGEPDRRQSSRLGAPRRALAFPSSNRQ
jgi:hypothetical protein